MANFVMGWIAGFASLAAGTIVGFAMLHVRGSEISEEN